MVESSIGKKMIFKCSQVLSFTAEKEATNKLPPDHSYVKCNKVPKNIAKTALAI